MRKEIIVVALFAGIWLGLGLGVQAATYTDDFNRGNGTSLGGNWNESENQSQAAEIISNQLRLWSVDQADQVLGARVYYNITPADDQYSQIEYAGKSGEIARSGPVIRVSTDGTADYSLFDGYYAQWSDGDDTLRLYSASSHDFSSTTSTALTQLGSNYSWTPTAGDKVKLFASGGQVSVALDTGSGFSTVIGPVTDSTHTGGAAGFAAQAVASDGTDHYVVWDNWEGGDPTYDLSGYRWYENQDSTDVGSVMADVNSETYSDSIGQQYRLRLLLHVSNVDLSSSGMDFKLQVAERSGSCDDSFEGESYEDVSAGSGTIRFYDNSTPEDGVALTGNENDPSHEGHTINNQTYEENNNFSNSQSGIGIGEDGLWDFTLVDDSATGNKGYCFRVVKASGNLIDSYSVLPELNINPQLTFTVAGVGANTVNNGITTSEISTYNTLPFENISVNEPKYVAHQLDMNTNTEYGYVVKMKLLSLLQGIYPANNIDPFAAAGVSWDTPVVWSSPDGDFPNVNTGWLGANTTDIDIPGWNNAAGKFGPVSTVSHEVMQASGRDQSTVYVTYGMEVNVNQPADLYSAVLNYTVLPTY